MDPAGHGGYREGIRGTKIVPVDRIPAFGQLAAYETLVLRNLDREK
jgi:hypothetical protein